MSEKHPSQSQIFPSNTTTTGPALAFVSLILIAGAIVLIFLTLLAGAVDKNPTNKFYFLQAGTSGLGNAAATTRWTFWNACSVVNGRNACPKAHPAYPFEPNRNFATSMSFGYDIARCFAMRTFSGGIHGLMSTDSGRKYYLETRFAFAFILIGLFFAVCALFLGLIALFSRIGSFLSSITCYVALLFQTITAALITYVSSQTHAHITPVDTNHLSAAPPTSKAATPSTPQVVPPA